MASTELLDRPDLAFSCWLQSGQGQRVVVAALEQRAAYEAISPRDLAVFRHALSGASGDCVAHEAPFGDAFGDPGSRWTVTCGGVGDSDRVGFENEMSRLVFDRVQALSFWRERFRMAEAHVALHGSGNDVSSPVHTRTMDDFLQNVRGMCHEIDEAQQAQRQRKSTMSWSARLKEMLSGGRESTATSKPTPR